jgi:hypothetical protein
MNFKYTHLSTALLITLTTAAVSGAPSTPGSIQYPHVNTATQEDSIEFQFPSLDRTTEQNLNIAQPQSTPYVHNLDPYQYQISPSLLSLLHLYYPDPSTLDPYRYHDQDSPSLSSPSTFAPHPYYPHPSTSRNSNIPQQSPPDPYCMCMYCLKTKSDQPRTRAIAIGHYANEPGSTCQDLCVSRQPGPLSLSDWDGRMCEVYTVFQKAAHGRHKKPYVTLDKLSFYAAKPAPDLPTLQA